MRWDVSCWGCRDYECYGLSTHTRCFPCLLSKKHCQTRGNGTFCRELNAADLRLLSGPPIDRIEGTITRERETISASRTRAGPAKRRKRGLFTDEGGGRSTCEEYSRVHGVVRNSEGEQIRVRDEVEEVGDEGNGRRSVVGSQGGRR